MLKLRSRPILLFSSSNLLLGLLFDPSLELSARLERKRPLLVESPPVLTNGGVENGARGGRGPRSAQRTCRE
jgi:hypothetical protein